MSMFIIPRVLGALLLSTCFEKSEINTHRTHAEFDCSVYWLAFYLICKFHWFWRYPITICLEIVVENFRPLAEAKCHTVWKMIVDFPPSATYKWQIQRLSSFAQHSPLGVDNRQTEKMKSDYIKLGQVLAPSRFISAMEILDILHAFERVLRHKTWKWHDNTVLLRF